MDYKNRISVCIVTYNSENKVVKAVKSLKKFTVGTHYKLFLFDNGSFDNTKHAVLSADSDAIFTENKKNIGFGKANNKIIPLLDTKYLAIVNPDIRIESDVLTDICDYLDCHNDVSMATPKILFPNGDEQYLPKRKPKFSYLLGRRLPIFKEKAKEYTMENIKIDEPIEIDFCTGCFSVIRSDVFKSLGGFDERFFMYFEDADLTLRAQKYGKTMYLPQFSVIHEWERSSSKSLKYLFIHIISMFKFFIKHNKK